MNALFCQKAKLGAVDALLNDSLVAKSSNPRPQGQGITIWFGLRTRVRFRAPPPIPCFMLCLYVSCSIKKMMKNKDLLFFLSLFGSVGILTYRRKWRYFRRYFLNSKKRYRHA